MKRTKLMFLIGVAFLLVVSCDSTNAQPKTESQAFKDDVRLAVSGDKIVNHKGEAVYLQGFGLGGMLHMENFINGLPANEQAVREGLLDVLGQENMTCSSESYTKIILPSRTRNTSTVWD